MHCLLHLLEIVLRIQLIQVHTVTLIILAILNLLDVSSLKQFMTINCWTVTLQGLSTNIFWDNMSSEYFVMLLHFVRSKKFKKYVLFLLFKVYTSSIKFCICINLHVMVSVLAQSAVDRGFEPRSSPTKDQKLVFVVSLLNMQH